jgi:hypothetical protein
MISGADSVLVIAGHGGPAAVRFLDEWAQRWPAMRVALDGPEVYADGGWPEVRDQVAPDAAEILVARDKDMNAAWEEHGYDIPGDPEGPFAVYYQPCPARRFTAQVTTDPYDRGSEFAFDPYEVQVVGAGLSLVTLVTPDLETDFSQQVITTFIESCVGLPPEVAE